MKPTRGLLLFCSVTLAGAVGLGVTLAREAPAARADRDLLAGTWQASEVRSISGTITGVAAAHYQLEFDGSAVVARGLSGVAEARGYYRVDPSTTPARIDLRLDSGIVLGIYRLDGDDLLASFNPIDLPEHLGLPERGRPTQWEPEERRFLFRFHRGNRNR